MVNASALRRKEDGGETRWNKKKKEDETGRDNELRRFKKQSVNYKANKQRGNWEGSHSKQSSANKHVL